MNLLSLLMGLSMLLSVSACRDSDDQPEMATLEFTVKGVYGDEPLVMFREYNYEEGMKVLFQLFQFYLSDIELVDANGEATLLRDVELVSFEEIQDEAAAARGITLSLEGIPPGEYEAIRMGVGVSPALNATSPKDYIPGHPLSDHYWSAALGYIFSKIEGKADTTGSAGLTADLTFHTGSNDIYQVIQLAGPIQLQIGQSTTLTLEADLKRVLVDGGGQFLDFRKYTIDHHVQPEVYEFIGANLPACIRLEK